MVKIPQNTSRAKSTVATTPGKNSLTLAIALSVFCFLLYGNTIWNDYSLDDELVTWNHPQVSKGIRALPEIFSTPYYEVSGNAGTLIFGYRPIAKATYAIERSLFGQNPHISHFLNVLLYLLTVLLVHRLIQRLFPEAHWGFPFLATLIFAAHPLHTEVVASLKNREEILALLGALGGMWFFLNYARNEKPVSLIYGLLCFFGGYLSKSSVMPFLVLYPLTLYFFTGIRPGRLAGISVAALVVLLAAQLGPALFLPDTIRPNAMVENPLYFENNLWIRAATGFTGLLHYLKLVFWPSPLLFYYGYDTLPVTGWADFSAVFSLLIHLGLFTLALVLFRRRHPVSYAILFYLVSIAMYSNILVPVVGIVGDRFTYVATLGVSVFMAWALFRVSGPKVPVQSVSGIHWTRLITLSLFVIFPYAALTIDRNKDWKDLATLYKADIQKLPRSVKANTQYAGNLLYNTYVSLQGENAIPPRGVTDEMIRHYKRSLEVMPDYYDALTGLGTVYSTLLGDQKTAIRYFEAASRSDSNNVASFVNLAYAWGELGNFPKSEVLYTKVLSMDSTKVKAYFKLAEIAFARGETEKAIRLNLLATRFDPYTDVPYLNIGNYKLLSRDTLGAVEWYEKAAAKQPNHELSMKLYMHYTQEGNPEKAAFYKKMADETKDVITLPRK